MSDKIDKAELIADYSQRPLDSKYMRAVAHDIRNRMNTIMMSNDILPDELKLTEGDPLKYIGLIRQASEDILVILDAAILAIAQRENTETQADT